MMFRDLKVIELASVLAGPSVGQFLAELGATVVKIENAHAGGDVTRSWKGAREKTDDRSAYFCSVNWGKKSVALDLTTPEGIRQVHGLVAGADIVLASYKPGDAEKLRVDYKTVSAINPHIIYGMITGYGSGNPRVGYDAIIQAETGFMSMNGEPNGPSLKMPVALVDVLAAHHLKEGILIALLNRGSTGRGECVEVSLVQAALASLVNQGTNWLVGGVVPAKQGSSHPNIAPYGDVFTTHDGRDVLLAVGSDRQFQDLCTLLDVGALGSDAKFKTNVARVENRLELNSVLQARVGQYDSVKLMEGIHRAKIPAGFIQNVQQALAMDEAHELLLEHGIIKGVRTYVGKAARGQNENFELLPPPRLGEHTHEFERGWPAVQHKKHGA
jgi:crotonobetainyl-CoA:carnitine CoA-transferase CaiB-like acyl-CoA transferase